MIKKKMGEKCPKCGKKNCSCKKYKNPRMKYA